jgi:hypothetical protein
MFDLLKTISQLDKEKVVCENKCIHEYDNENGMEENFKCVLVEDIQSNLFDILTRAT